MLLCCVVSSAVRKRCPWLPVTPGLLPWGGGAVHLEQVCLSGLAHTYMPGCLCAAEAAGFILCRSGWIPMWLATGMALGKLRAGVIPLLHVLCRSSCCHLNLLSYYMCVWLDTRAPSAGKEDVRQEQARRRPRGACAARQPWLQVQCSTRRKRTGACKPRAALGHGKQSCVMHGARASQLPVNRLSLLYSFHLHSCSCSL